MRTKQPVTVWFHEPPADLARFFTSFYCADFHVPGPELIADWLHPEWSGLRIFSDATPISQIAGHPPLSGADIVVTGPSSVPLHFSIGTTRLWGFGLFPLGWATFVGQPADRFANTVNNGRTSHVFSHFQPLAERLLADDRPEGSNNPAQMFSIMEDFFRNDAPQFGNGDARIQTTHAALVEAELPTVAHLAELCSVHPRTLERLCLRHFGFPPKLLLRRQRFMRSLSRFMLEPSLGWIRAIDSLYVDQSHFVRDCHDFLGMAPREYAALDHPILSAFVRERKQALGSPVQTLDPPG